MNKPTKLPILFPANPDLKRANHVEREPITAKAVGPNNALLIDYDPDAQFTIAKADDIFDHLLAVAKKVKIPPDAIYAMRKTGRIVTERNKHLLTSTEAAEWKAALDEYRRLN